MSKLWTKDIENDFFRKSRDFASPEQLFYYGDDKRYYAYYPKTYKGIKTTLQSRNSLIGKFTEKYSVDLLQDYAKKLNLYAVQDVICDEIGLSRKSPADVAICKSKKRIQKPEDIKLLVEVKMSIVWNWELRNPKKDEKIICLGDFKSHRGNPGILRSDSMLKAIGKSINIRVSGKTSSKIPIIILGNTPITENYIEKVDHLKASGIIQGFWSINPHPLDEDIDNLKQTKENGFIRMDSYDELVNNLDKVLSEPLEFFSSMKSKKELGKLIKISNIEIELEKKAEKFLSLIR